MALDTAKTITSGSASTAIKNRYYDQLFLRIAESKLVHKQLGQINRSIPQGVNGYGAGAVYWTRFSNLADVSAGQGEGVPTTAVQLTSVNVTGSTAQYDAAVSVSDLMAYTAMGDVMKIAVERLGYNAGKSIDNIVRGVVATSGTSQGATGVYWSAVPATGVLSIAEIKKSARTLNRNDAMELGDGFFVAVAHPDALFDLQSDTTTGGWIDANKYTESNASKLLTGEVGKLHGVRFLQTSNGYIRGSSFAAGSAVVASATLYVTSVFGTDAFGVTELQNLKTFVKGFGSGGTGDPTDKIATAGWKTTFGAAMLNSAFFVNITHAVSSTA